MSENNVVNWSNDNLLKWSDFKAESNPAIFEDSYSTIKYGFTWIVNSDKINEEIVFSIHDIKLSVEFHPLLSWVRKLESTDDLLKHEQGHFDLAEILKRDHDKVFEKIFYDKIFPTRGQNDSQRKQFAKEDSGKMISIEVNKLNLLLLQKRKEYNIKTNFGKNIKNQIEYNKNFDKLKF